MTWNQLDCIVPGYRSMRTFTQFTPNVVVPPYHRAGTNVYPPTYPPPPPKSQPIQCQWCASVPALIEWGRPSLGSILHAGCWCTEGGSCIQGKYTGVERLWQWNQLDCIVPGYISMRTFTQFTPNVVVPRHFGYICEEWRPLVSERNCSGYE